MSDAGRLTFSIGASFAAHAALVAAVPGAFETQARVQARKGRVSLVVRRRPPTVSRRPACEAPSPQARRTSEKRPEPLPEPPREAERAAPLPRPARETEDALRPIRREPAPPEPSEEAPPVREESGVRNPRLLGDARPRYPACCRSGSCNGGEPREGYVWVEVEVLPDGTAGKIELLDTSACPRMQRSVETFFRKTRFLPATRAGVPVRGKLRKKVVFRLVDD